MNISSNSNYTPAAAQWHKVLLAGAGLVLSLAVHAAGVPANWWVDITNDRAADIKTMLAQGADPNAVNSRGQPAIMQAIRDGAWHVYDALAADSRTKVNITNINNETPLMYLAVVGQTRRAEALIARGAEVNRLGWTPLQYAASKGHLDTVQMLVAHKAIIDAPSPDGTTALMMAAFAGSQPVVQYLLDQGAVPIVQNLGGHDAADWALQGKHDELAAKLHALIQKTLAEHAAQRARDEAGQAGAASGAQTGEGATGGTPGAAGEPAAAPAPRQAQPAPAPESSGSGNSTSKYFNPEDNAGRPASH